MLIDGGVLISGEIARKSGFETGYPGHMALRANGWQRDPLILDDRCFIVSVLAKALLIITGCGLAGVINIIRNAQALTGTRRIYCVVGGFHLFGPFFWRIALTIEALKELRPTWVVPGHCTGWEAVHAIARELPEAFTANSVGTSLAL